MLFSVPTFVVVAAAPASSAVDSALGCPARGSHEWLATRPGVERWVVVFHTTPETEPARTFATLHAVAEGPGDGGALLLEWGDRRVRVRAAP